MEAYTSSQFAIGYMDVEHEPEGLSKADENHTGEPIAWEHHGIAVIQSKLLELNALHGHPSMWAQPGHAAVDEMFERLVDIHNQVSTGKDTSSQYVIRALATAYCCISLRYLNRDHQQIYINIYKQSPKFTGGEYTAAQGKQIAWVLEQAGIPAPFEMDGGGFCLLYAPVEREIERLEDEFAQTSYSENKVIDIATWVQNKSNQ